MKSIYKFGRNFGSNKGDVELSNADSKPINNVPPGGACLVIYLTRLPRPTKLGYKSLFTVVYFIVLISNSLNTPTGCKLWSGFER